MDHLRPPPPVQTDAQIAAQRHAAIDRAFHATLGSLTGGLSPMGLATAWFDWGVHLAGSPARQAALHEHAVANAARALASPLAPGAGTCAHMAADSRFRDPAWRRHPFDLFARWFLLTEDWWDDATADVAGVAPRHAQMTRFAARQTLDMLAPSNFAATNPAVLDRTRREHGQNLLRGFHNWIEDLARQTDHPGDAVGSTLATTPGEVVFRNHLIELIRYCPTTPQVQAEPLLIVPAWIMKYYILDLSTHNSMVRFLVDQGIEVWMISWRNPDADDAGLSMEDYVRLGVFAALDAIGRCVPGRQVHTAGYCLGGTLLAIAAAALVRDGDARIASLTLLAAQVDFTEPGEISLFVDDSQVAFLEDIMADQGYLRSDQMSGAFQMLRSNDLIWSRTIRDYLMGERGTKTDLMAWNADATRMPARMHSEYLRQLFLENRLALGRFRVGGAPVSIEDITVPVFAVGTETDHVAPWRSVWKITRLANGDKTFVLTSGGHNAGIVSEPGHPHRHFRMAEVRGHTRDADLWQAGQTARDGSWWAAWAGWLAAQSSGSRDAVPGVWHGALCPAPGTYVFG